jgi:hypothetical protein
MLYLTISFKFKYFYLDQFKAPCFHSCKRPIKRIRIKITLVTVHHHKLEILKIIIIGKIKAISTSKIKKIIVIKKNRIEKGNREEFIGSNPHSNGEVFSRSFIVFFASNEARYITTIEIINTIKAIKYKFIITYTKIFRPCDWKSHILLYYICLSTSSINRYI